VPRSKKQQCHLIKARRLRKCEQRVDELSASAVKLIMQRHSQLSEEELVGIQDNYNADGYSYVPAYTPFSLLFLHSFSQF
jgi:hypothetical protein